MKNPNPVLATAAVISAVSAVIYDTTFVTDASIDDPVVGRTSDYIPQA